MSLVVDVLKRAREKIAKPEHWIKDVLFRNESGTECVSSVNATCFCSLGALYSNFARGSMLEDAIRESEDLLNTLAKEAGFYSIVTFNDSDKTTHADVLAIFDKAIALAESKS